MRVFKWDDIAYKLYNCRDMGYQRGQGEQRRMDSKRMAVLLCMDETRRIWRDERAGSCEKGARVQGHEKVHGYVRRVHGYVRRVQGPCEESEVQ